MNGGVIGIAGLYFLFCIPSPDIFFYSSTLFRDNEKDVLIKEENYNSLGFSTLHLIIII